MSSLLNKFIFILLLSAISSIAYGQKSRAQLEEEKVLNQQNILRAQRVLNQTSQRKKASIGKVKSLNTQINQQQRQIDLVTEDIELTEIEISELEIANKELQKDLSALKKEYAEMLYIASKSSGKLNKLSFLFSARSFNDLVMRYKYLEQYTDNRKKQVEQITIVSATLITRQEELTIKRSLQEKVIIQKLGETKKLSALKREQASTVSQLSLEEKSLRVEINKSKEAIQNLDNLISSLIRKSKNSTTSNEAVINTALSKTFENNKRRLPWPVQNGFISDKFGVKNHPVLKNIKIDNYGVDIQTSPNARVSSVFDGIVLDISQIPGLNNVVAVQHGEYFTVYANLKSVNINLQDKVIAGQLIGIAGEKDGEYEINFQVWHQFTKMNPELWLARH